MAVKMRREDVVAFVTLMNPPVNAIGLAVREGLMEALDWVENQTGLARVVLSGSARIFAAGADAREFDAGPVAPHLPDIIDRIESCEVPWIAAITGAALGGGCELILGCRYRIAKPGAMIGLPEVTLGVIPGAGGTQRLPRLTGLRTALELIATGKPVSAERAVEIGLVHGIADDPVAIASHLDPGTYEQEFRVSGLPQPSADDAAVAASRDLIARKSPGQIAPGRAIDLVAASARLPFPEAIREERATFVDLRKGDQARALRHIFFAERAAKPPADLAAPAAVPDLVAVAGGGMMGSGIAWALLNAGLSVVLVETDEEGAARARSNVEGLAAASLKRGLITEAERDARMDRFSASTDYADAAGAGLAIEAAFEDMAVKRDVFRALQDHLPPDAVLATNTSYLDVNEIASRADDPACVLGLHFFAPAHIMRLLEIVRGDITGDRALATGYALAKRLRKVPVLSGVCDGFIGNRILSRYREAADTVLMDGSTPWEIDEAMVAFGYAMGPYETQDLSGLDIAHANRRRQDATRDPARRYIPIADRMVELGKLGRKTGAGWYRYPGGGGKVEDPVVADLALEEAHFAGITRQEYAPSEIRRRLVLAMINEAADILHEGIAARAADIDLVTVFGYGFPRWRGGLMCYADTLGVTEVHGALRDLETEDPVAWKPSPLFAECEAAGLTFAEYRRPEQ